MQNELDKIELEARKKVEYDAIPVISFLELQVIVNKWMLIADPGVVKVVLASIIGNTRIDSDPIFLFLTAPSGGGKTELMNALLKVPEYYPLSHLTPNTFLSGYKSKEKEPSLLHQLGTNKVIGFKDFTTILDGNQDEKKILIAQFREIHDGYATRRTGTGDELHWEGKIGFLAGCTPILEQKMAMMGAMGERFMSYRIRQPKQKAVRAQMRKNIGKEVQMRDEMQQAFAGFLKGIMKQDKLPDLPPQVNDLVESMTDFIAISRTVVMRSFDSKRTLEYINPSEMTTRTYKTLYLVAQSLILINGGSEWHSEDTYVIKNLAISSIHSSRYNLIKEIQKYKTKVRTSTLAVSIGLPTSTVRNHLEELAAISMDDGDIRILHRTHQGVGKSDLWNITASMTVILKEMGDYVEPFKEDEDFDKQEEEIPVEELSSSGSEQDAMSEQDLTEEMNNKLADLTGDMTPEEMQKLGI